MTKSLSIRAIVILLAISMAWLVTACSPQAPAPTNQATLPAPTSQEAISTLTSQETTPASTDEVSIPYLDDLEQAVSSGSKDDLLALFHYASLPCTKETGLGGPPKCREDEAEGTLVDVMPILGPEGHYMRPSELEAWRGIGGAQLLVAYRVSENTYSDQFYPAGTYGVAFFLADQGSVVVFQVTEDGVVRIDYSDLGSFQNILKSSKILVGPFPVTE